MTDLYNASMGQEADEEILLTLEQYEEAKESLAAIIERAEAARRLRENPDFIELIMDGYLTHEPKRLVELMASGKLNPATMTNCVKDVESVGSFRNYLRMHMTQGQMAVDELASLEEAREESIRIEAEM